MTTPVELVVEGAVYSGWTEVAVRSSLDSIAREFTAVYTSGLAEGRPDIQRGDACTVRTEAGVVVLTGYVDDVEDAYDDTSHQLTCTGRSIAGDLVDSSAERKGGQWRRATIRQIVEDLVRPFGVSVRAAEGVDLTPTVRAWALQEGETVHEVLERLARAYGFLWSSSARGDLMAVRAGSARTRTALEFGRNIARGRSMSSMRERFSSYSVVSQSAADANVWGTNAAHIRATVTDDDVRRHRPLRLVADSQLNQPEAEARARFERNLRFGRGTRLQYEVRDWQTTEGVWEINTLVPVRDPTFGLDRELLLAACELSYGPEGSKAILELALPEAYDVRAEVPKRKGVAVFG